MAVSDKDVVDRVSTITLEIFENVIGPVCGIKDPDFQIDPYKDSLSNWLDKDTYYRRRQLKEIADKLSDIYFLPHVYVFENYMSPVCVVSLACLDFRYVQSVRSPQL